MIAKVEKKKLFDGAIVLARPTFERSTTQQRALSQPRMPAYRACYAF